jgi:hypothetical protein
VLEGGLRSVCLGAVAGRVLVAGRDEKGGRTGAVVGLVDVPRRFRAAIC